MSEPSTFQNSLRLEKSVLSNAVFAIQVLLLFLLFFEDKVSIPRILQPIGRAHTLFLHLPIGLLFLLAVLPLLKREIKTTNYRAICSFLLHLCAITAAAAALLGFFLSQEEGYASELMTWHKWTGVGVSFLTYGLLILHENFAQRTKLFHAAVYTNIALLIATGHLGGSLTHGEDFLLAPLRDKKETLITEATPIYVAVIEPIMEAKCYACHNTGKSKANLIMTDLASLEKGGKHGPIWVAHQPDSSRMLQRMYLPIEDEYHMPPKGKTQLTTQEIELFHQWILDGAKTDKSFAAYKSEDTLLLLAKQFVEAKTSIEKSALQYDFPAVAATKIERLNTPFRSVHQLAQGSPALHAEIFVRNAYKANFLTDLLDVKAQITSLNLANLPIKDEDIGTIAAFKNLEKLILNNTDISGETLSKLAACTHLQQLALSGTVVQVKHLKRLKELPNLRQVFVWNTALSATEFAALNDGNIAFDMGFVDDASEMLQLSTPLLKNKSTLLQAGEQVILESKFPGVEIRYTTDGSEPDSLNAAVFEEPIALSSVTQLKARAYRENWLSSEVVSFQFFPKGLDADSLILLSPADKKYQGSGASTLQDELKGKADNFGNANWLGYREEPMQVLADFGENAPELSEVILSYAENHPSYIMPPKEVKLWAGNDVNALKKISTFTPIQPDTYGAIKISPARLKFPKAAYRYYKIVAAQLPRLPKWHAGYAGKSRSWVFVDEVFFYE